MFFKEHKMIPTLAIDTVMSGSMFRVYGQVLMRVTNLKTKPTQRIEDRDGKALGFSTLGHCINLTLASHYQG